MVLRTQDTGDSLKHCSHTVDELIAVICLRALW
jgi:hypothetical protein